MAQQITVWRREDADTTPRGLGNPPTYSIDEPYHSDSEMVWAVPVACTLPVGYTVAECADGSLQLYDADGRREKIIDDHGHPAVVTGIGRNHAGKAFAYCLRLDKQGGRNDCRKNPGELS